ncbi:MAG: hypothetical protein KTR24_16090 [Saprospiraceae bacterium]|nr:hypothetical protein [Saprospiraceae bacterium]
MEKIIPILGLALLFACSNSQSARQEAPTASTAIEIEPARYQASINLEHVPDSMRGYSAVSEVYFGLEEENRFVYEVNAMGRPMNDVGKWQVEGDTLYIYDLEKGPNSKFHIVPNDDGTFHIYGPNNFILKKDERYVPTKN